MIKKALLWIWISILTFVWFSYWQAPWITSPTFSINRWDVNTYNGITTSFDPYANFTSDTYLSKVLFYNYDTSNPFRSATFWHNGRLYIVFWGLSSNILKWQGYVYLCKVESLDSKQFCRTYYDEGEPSLTGYYTEEYSNPDSFQFYWYNSPHVGCFVYESLGEKLCFWVQQDNSNWLDTSVQLFDSVPTWYNDERFSQFAWDSYWSNSWGGWGSTLIPLDSDVDMVINYYEQRGYRESMCYVWTDNLTATFWASGISFDEWSGDSIFWLYSSIYSWFWSNIIQNVWKFINVRDINYWQWFYCDWENCPRWLAELTWNDVNITLNYTWLTFPFANKPVAIYFMASNLYETYNIDTHWADVAFYCYSKLNRDSIVEWTINYSNIKEQAWTGVTDKVETYNQYLIDYYTPKWTFQVPTSWEFWDSFWSSWDYSSDNSQSISSSFSDYFTKFTNVFQGYSPAYSVWIIPDWIIYPLIFLILFRIMKH